MGIIRLRTKIPGPKSLRLMRAKNANVSNGISITIPIFIKRASGAAITDVDDNTFIDFSGGIGATNSGHGNKQIISAIKKQA